MDNKTLNYFQKRLYNEKKRVESIIEDIETNGTVNSNEEMANEISIYDNHTGDAAGNLIDVTRDITLKENEVAILQKINNALKKIEKDQYGKCSTCGKDINIGRLQFIPYAENCIECQNKINDKIEAERNKKTSTDNFNYDMVKYAFEDKKDKIGFDGEDSYQSLSEFNSIDNVYDEYFYDDHYYVDHMDLISNEQYKNQLPD